jgi:glycosyltransferase involved in cell wall biosynthesis
MDSGEAYTISVIITCYNESAYIGQAIESALDQTRQPDEVLIVDDNSTDESREIIEEYEYSYDEVHSHFNSENVGLAETRNIGCRESSGDLFMYLDGDDRILPNKIDQELAVFLDNPGADIVFSKYRVTDPDGETLYVWGAANTPPTGDVFVETFSRNWPSGNLYRNELMRRSVIEELKYDEDLEIYIDWDFRIRATNEHSVAYNPNVAAEYRNHAAGISGQTDTKTHLEYIKYIYEKNLDLLDGKPDIKRDVDASLKPLFKQKEIQIEMEENGTKLPVVPYLQYLLEYPAEPRTYKFGLRILLPKRLYKQIAQLYQDLKEFTRRC